MKEKEAPRFTALLTIEQTAEMLNFSRETIRQLIKSKKLPALRIEGSWRVDPDELKEWLVKKKY